MNKKIALSAISILTSLALLGGATFAFFSDVGTSSENVFGAGALDLKLSDDTPETNQDNVIASFGAADLGPGDCTDPQQLRLRNSGTVPGNHVDIDASNSNGAMAAFLRLDTLNYDSVDKLANIAESNGNGFKDLADWAADVDGLHDLGLTDLNTDHNLDMVVCLDESALNDLQGASNSADFTATLRQQTHVSEI